MNPKLRKQRWETYAVVPEYLVKFPNMKNAIIMWSYRQQTTRVWCHMPPNIGYRFDSKHKLIMIDALIQIEETMREMCSLSEAVMDDPLDQKVVRSRVAWSAAVDIGLITKVFAVPKKRGGQYAERPG